MGELLIDSTCSIVFPHFLDVSIYVGDTTRVFIPSVALDNAVPLEGGHTNHVLLHLLPIHP